MANIGNTRRWAGSNSACGDRWCSPAPRQLSLLITPQFQLTSAWFTPRAAMFWMSRFAPERHNLPLACISLSWFGYVQLGLARSSPGMRDEVAFRPSAAVGSEVAPTNPVPYLVRGGMEVAMDLKRDLSGRPTSRPHQRRARLTESLPRCRQPGVRSDRAGR